MKSLVLVTASWCSACQPYKPVVQRVASELGLALQVLDCEEDLVQVAGLGVCSLPTLILYKNGEEVDRWSGAFSAVRLKAMVKAVNP